MSNKFPTNIQAVPRESFPVTKSDTAQDDEFRRLRVGTGGTLVFRLKDDTADRTLTNVANAEVIDGHFTHIMNATTCTDMVAFI